MKTAWHFSDKNLQKNSFKEISNLIKGLWWFKGLYLYLKFFQLLARFQSQLKSSNPVQHEVWIHEN